MKAHRKRRSKGQKLRCAAAAALAAVAVTGLVTLGAQTLEATARTQPAPAREAPAIPAAALPREPVFSAPPREPDSFRLDVSFLSQAEEWPTGCESVSAVMALNHAGIDVTVSQFVEEYLPLGNAPYLGEDGELYGCDPREKFPGDPASEDGWGCYAPVVRRAMEDLLADRASPLAVRDLTGTELDKLCRYWVAQGTPVLIWASIDMVEPYEDLTFYLEDTGEPFTWIYPLHCLLLTGWDEDSYFFNDPLAGKDVAYPRADTRTAYIFLGKQALAVPPAGAEPDAP